MGSAVSGRLHKYLKATGIDGRETPHSFRVGISYTLKGLGCTSDQIAQYVGLRSTDMALHYTRHSTVSGSSQLLEKITLNVTSPDCTFLCTSSILRPCKRLSS